MLQGLFGNATEVNARELEKELAESTATVTVSAANPMIALAPQPAAVTR